MKVGIIVPNHPEIVLFPLYEEIKKSRRNVNVAMKELKKNYGLSSNSSRNKSFTTSVGALSLATYLKCTGHETTLLHQEFEEKEGSWEDNLDKLIKSSELIGISSLTESYDGSVKILKRIKEARPNLPVVTGGPHVTYLDENGLKDGFDYVVRDLGEEPLQKLAEALEGKIGLQSVPSLSALVDGKVIRTPMLPSTTAPFPNPDYTLMPKAMRENTSISFFTSRGCPFSCSFCVENTSYVTKPTDMVVEDLSNIARYFPVNQFFVSDSIFGVNKKRTRELTSKIKSNFPDKYFFFQNRVDLFDSEQLEYLVGNNFIGMWIGLESLNDRTLKRMNKGPKARYSNYVEGLQNIQGIVPYIEASFIIGYPGETREELNQTLERVESLVAEGLVSSASARIFMPYPGNRFFSSGEGISIRSRDFSQYDRHGFPPPYSLSTMSEFELYFSLLQFNSTVSRALHKKHGLNTYESIDLESMQRYKGK